MSQNAALDAHAIRRRAHQRWLDRGCPVGSSEQDWLEAERELSAESVRAGAPVRTLTTAPADPNGDRPRATRAPRRIVTRAASAPAARLLVALVPAAAEALQGPSRGARRPR